MSGDLISRSELIQSLAVIAKKFAKTEEQQALMGRVFYIIEHKSTAYDTDKVVEQIKGARDEDGCIVYVDDEPAIQKNIAIQIVKAGGKE